MGYVMGYVPRFLMGDLHALTDGRDPDEYLFANSKGGRIGISSWSQKNLASRPRRRVNQGGVESADHRACAPPLVREHGDRLGLRSEDAADRPRPLQREGHTGRVRGIVAGPPEGSDKAMAPSPAPIPGRCNIYMEER